MVMKIKKKQITVKDLKEDYVNNAEKGVVGYGGKLDIRPPYQREFVYDDDKRDAVINSIIQGYPLNIMYWNKKSDGSFEVLDGQQRTISICEYVHGNFSFNKKVFSRQFDDIQDKILKYPLDIYVCEGPESERLEWFKIINMAGVELTKQEMRNAIYAGPWTAEAKIKFSKTGCPAYQIGHKFVPNGKSPIRQEYLELALKWISNDDIAEYMNQHAKDTDCNELWLYWENMIAWINATFISDENEDYSNEMKNVAWGELFNKYGKKTLDAKKIQKRVAELFLDDDVQKYSGIYPYVLDGDERHLNIRLFDRRQKTQAYKKQKGICANKKNCPRKGKKCTPDEMHADHITPWSKNGKTISENCQMLCADCNRRKGAV